MISELHKAPFPYVGGKQHAAPAVWAALGDVDHYVEPFAGSLAVLLRRPHPANQTYYSETVNDLDGLLVNAWRSIQLSPDATAEAASYPVSEGDLHARHLALLKWRAEHELERLMANPLWHDPVMGGWWLWGISCWIGSGWTFGEGPWVVGDDGRITCRQDRGQEGVSRQRPHVSNNGRGVNHAGLREPGVTGNAPESHQDAQGAEFHPMTMPELRRWFQFLSARLRHVRILNGDWRRAVTTGVTHTLPVRMGDGIAGVFLDPPYAASAGRAAGLYAHDALEVAHLAADWAIAHGSDDPKLRIVLAGFEGEHGERFRDAGWREVEWFKAGFLRGGYGHQQGRERLWLSPHCLTPNEGRQAGLWD